MKPKALTDKEAQALLKWLVRCLLTDSQLDVTPPGYRQALRFIVPED